MTAFTPHTADDVEAMLASIGVSSIDDLFAPIPAALRDPPIDLALPMSEPEVAAHLTSLAARNHVPTLSFLGGGFYDHYVPAAVRAVISRGEFATAYTPYQAEASQGTLQSQFEFQTMVAELLGLEFANSSLYDAGTGLVEAVNLAAQRRSARRVLVSGGVNPRYIRVLQAYAGGLGIEVEILPVTDGGTSVAAVASDAPILALVVQQPNRWGYLEDAAELAAAGVDAGAYVIGVTDPVSCGLIAPPGEWGAHIAVAEGQALGNPIAFGGQCVGLFACAGDLVRHMPGRLVGETTDANGRRGWVLTLQAREQHIRREKAGSNICTNQALFALAVAVQLAWLGPQGLHHAAALSATQAHVAAQRIESETSFRRTSNRPFVREFTLRGPASGAAVSAGLRARGVWVGPFDEDDPHAFTLAFTERRTDDDIDALVQALKAVAK